MSVCFLDMDGVLVDFVRSALALHDMDLKHTEVDWDFWKKSGKSEPDFWAPMDYDFWANMEWTEEGEELLAGLESIYGRENICLLTSPIETPGAVEGKIDWLKKNMPAYKRRFLVGSPKHLVSGPGKTLIDDHDKNVDEFRAGGGIAHLVPRPWNTKRGLCDAAGNFDVAAFLG